MKKYIIVLVLLFFQNSKSQIQYVSPGIGFAWDLNGNFVFSGKLSYGVLERGRFYNITVGAASSSNAILYPHSHVEVQYGQISSVHVPRQFFYGGGIGFTIPTWDNESKISLRTSVFAGYFIFLNSTFLFDKKIQTEIGGQIVLPLPMSPIKT